MHDARPPLAADAGELLAAMRQQRVDQRAVLVAGGGMHDETGRLVEHDQVGVLVKDGEGDRLRLGRGRRGRRQVEHVGGARPHRLGRFAEHRGRRCAPGPARSAP